MLLHLLQLQSPHSHCTSTAAPLKHVCVGNLVLSQVGLFCASKCGLTFLQGDLGSRRAKYEARWHIFATAGEGEAIKMADVPWLVEDLNQDVQQLTTFVLYGAITAEEQRRRSRAELMRWHPDKFVARFGRRLDVKDRHSILDKVKAVSQLLNTINAAV